MKDLRLTDDDYAWHRSPTVDLERFKHMIAREIGVAVGEFRALRKAGIIIGEKFNEAVAAWNGNFPQTAQMDNRKQVVELLMFFRDGGACDMWLDRLGIAVAPDVVKRSRFLDIETTEPA